jgi:hypothetical protein
MPLKVRATRVWQFAVSVRKHALDAVDGFSTGRGVPMMWVLLMHHDSEEATMRAVTTIGLDIAKRVLQLHGIDEKGNVLIRRKC